MRNDPQHGVLSAVARLERAFDTRMTHLENTLGARLTTLEGKFDALPQQFVTVREFTQEQNTAREDRSSVREQLATLNEWRAGLLQAQIGQMTGIQQQIGNVAGQAAKEAGDAKGVATQHVIEIDRAAIGYLVTILLFLAGIIVAHAVWH